MKGLYAIVDPSACRGRDPVAVAEAVLRGGCAALQLRDKTGTDRAVLGAARALREISLARGVPFFVDDRLDVALACGADGVHVGQDDLPLAVVRSLAPRLRVGVSTHTEAQRAAAEAEGADLLGFGPVFATTTKENPDAVVGVDEVARVARVTRVPVVAIGGIDLPRARLLASHGVHLAAVISAVCGADDPEHAAAAIHAALLEGGA